MIFRFRHVLVTALLCLAGTAASVAAPPPLVWRGDTTSAHAFVNDMAKAWHRAGHPRLVLQPFNTVSGIDAVAHDTADIAGSVRGRAARRPDEAKLVFTPVAWDALVIITNRHNPVDNLSLKQLHDIYYGLLHNWSQVGGSALPMHVFADASPTAGIEFSLRQLLFGRGNQPVAAPRLYLTVEALQSAVELDPQAIGVTTLSNVYGNRKLKMLSIDGIQPSVANVANGSYPLYTPLYLVTRPAGSDAAKAQRISQFVAFAGNAKVEAAMRRHHLVPYAEAPALAGHLPARIASIAAEIKGQPKPMNGPVAAPGATYASRVAVAPTSERTSRAYQRMLAQRQADAAAAKSGVTWYTARSQDTLASIAKAHGVSADQLRAWNHLKDDTIHKGQRLVVGQH
ncbi:MAG TPA: substrate-binding domain-containing protein [Rhodanobacteraceae bacterium]